MKLEEGAAVVGGVVGAAVVGGIVVGGVVGTPVVGGVVGAAVVGGATEKVTVQVSSMLKAEKSMVLSTEEKGGFGPVTQTTESINAGGPENGIIVASKVGAGGE